MHAAPHFCETGTKKEQSKNKISEKPPSGPQTQVTVIRNEPACTTVTLQTNNRGRSSADSSGEIASPYILSACEPLCVSMVCSNPTTTCNHRYKHQPDLTVCCTTTELTHRETLISCYWLHIFIF